MRKFFVSVFYIFALLLWPGHRVFALPVVSDVTPFGFSVIWAGDYAAEPEIRVFTDPQGVEEITSQLEIVSFPLRGGDAGGNVSNWTARAAWLRNRAQTLGMLKIQVHGCRPDTTYYFRLVIKDGEGGTVNWPEDALAQVTVPWENSFVADARALLIELEGEEAEDTSAWLGAVYAPETMSPLSAYAGDGTGDNRLFFNLSNFFALDGGNWRPDDMQELTVEIMVPGREVIRKTVTIPYDGEFKTVSLHVHEINRNTDLDTDGDGLSDELERNGCTDPLLADSDHDGLADGLEDSDHNGIIAATETNPCIADTDDDGLDDGEEALQYGTDPLKRDSDDDGYDDYEEVSMGSAPLVAESRPDYSFYPADLDFDGDVDGIDMAMLQNCYGKSKGENGYLRRADINRDNEINDLDLDFFITEFGLAKGRSVYMARLDLDGDGDIDGLDLYRLLAAYGRTRGETGYEESVDVIGDGRIDIRDISLFSLGFGARRTGIIHYETDYDQDGDVDGLDLAECAASDCGSFGPAYFAERFGR